MALVVVLCCLVLLSAVLLAFLAATTTEIQSSKSYAGGTAVKLLADSTVSLVMGQIKDATRGVDSDGDVLAWASQPGMIRNYDTSGNAAGYFKLYSWDGMVGSEAFNPSLASEVPASNWFVRPAIYTDLNEPVLKAGTGTRIYPIVDPAATNSVKGFRISGAPISSRNTAPMPVKWLYVLEDGTISVAGGTGTNSATVAGATSSNPIVGRMAFWTDDDTCKININTAAGDMWVDETKPPAPSGSIQTGNPGSFWDTPRIVSVFDENLAWCQPVQNEYQRYSGHPATTYLSAVFPKLTSSEIYQIAPRIKNGGSLGGTLSYTTTFSGQGIIPDSERLYASVDELLFSTNLVTSLRDRNPTLNNTAIEQARFFLTARSRAPEVNLFNLPRVVAWPLSNVDDINHRTAFDSLIGYCGTLSTNSAAPNAYYFQRSDPTSPMNDLPEAVAPAGLGRNRGLITYLRNLTSLPIPGFGPETFLSKYSDDRDQILTEIFDYIRTLNLFDSSLPSPFVTYTKSLKSPLIGSGGGQGQVVPIQDNVPSTGSVPPRGFGRFPTITEASFIFVGAGQTVLTETGTQTSVVPGHPPIAGGKTRVQAAFFFKFFNPSMGYVNDVPNFQVKVSFLQNFLWGDDGVADRSMGFSPPSTSFVSGEMLKSLLGGSALPNGLCSTTHDFPTGGNITFSGGKVEIKILDPHGTTVLQTFTLNFPEGTFPVPRLAPLLTVSATDRRDFRALSGMTTVVTSGTTVTVATGSTSIGQARFVAPPGSNVAATYITSVDVVRSVAANTDPRIIMGMVDVPESMFSPVFGYHDSSRFLAHSLYDFNSAYSVKLAHGALVGTLVPQVDVWNVSSPSHPANNIYQWNDFNFASATLMPDGLQFTGSTTTLPANTLANGGGVRTVEAVHALSGGYTVPSYGVYAGSNGTSGTVPGDWDTGTGSWEDEPFINKADEGLRNPPSAAPPYYGSNLSILNPTSSSTFFTPNRQMPSAGMFGSLSTGVMSGRPWQTLLFRPDPTGNMAHLGAQDPPDHLLLDLFTMPVVEPYAISDPFSTAGKINMNYQIVPFTYITRNTGILAVLRSEQMLAVPCSDNATYKNFNYIFAPQLTPNRRYYLNLDENTGTLAGFARRFAGNDLFRSASEICNIWLVPAGTDSNVKNLNYDGMQNFWTATSGPNGALTGDNIRERPYANIYPRLTTKSNTYTVHCRVQTLKKAPGTNAGEWVEGKDVITGEYRGSATIERYLETGQAIPDYASASSPSSLMSLPPLDKFYKLRVIETKQFTP